MYLEQIKLQNTGPLANIDITTRFSAEGNPLPLLVVGPNGAGKSVFLAHLVSALADAQGTIFEDSDVEGGKVYKLRSPQFIKYGEQHSMASVSFSDNYEVHELQMSAIKSDQVTPLESYPKWGDVPEGEAAHYSSNWRSRNAELRENLQNCSHIYFPPNRFEDPAWLNEQNLRNKAEYFIRKGFANFAERPLVQYAPLRGIQNWLLDMIYDSYALERVRVLTPTVTTGMSNPAVQEIRNGPASKILIEIENFLRVFFNRQGRLLWDIGRRSQRSIGLSIDTEVAIGNLFGLSTGQTAILNFFLSIIRDFDLSNAPFEKLADVNGIIIVDEIDLHLHADMQHELLPKLMKLFPKVQFIITTHSPLFLMGLEHVYGAGGFQLVELPAGEEIEVERFSEFEAAYRQMKDTAQFEEDVRARVANASKPLLYLEGETDILYLQKAAALLEKKQLLAQFQLIDSGGHGNLTKIWKGYTPELAGMLPQKTVLLYDCDTQIVNNDKGMILKRVIPEQERKIGKGIENVFPESAISKALEAKRAFVDITPEQNVVRRGKNQTLAEIWEVNVNEKKNLCDWLCANGTQEDFSNFSIVFDVLDEVISGPI